MTKTNIKRYLASGLLASTLAVAATTAQAQSINCARVASDGAAYSAIIVASLNRDVAGASHRLNRRKTLRVNSVDSISFSGCNVAINANVTLVRKIRRNARGNMRLTARVTELNTSGNRVCLGNARVDSLRLSNTLRVGEAAYRWVANRVIPGTECRALF